MKNIRYEIIATHKYLLIVDDSEQKMGDWSLQKHGSVDNVYIVYHETMDKISPLFAESKKIIAHLPLNGSEYMDGVPLLPPVSGPDDVQRMAIDSLPTFINGNYTDELKGFQNGYNKATDKYRYTEDDLRQALSQAFMAQHEGYDITADDIIKSLERQRHPVAFVCEMEYDCCNRYENCKGCDATEEMINLRRMVTTFANGQTELVGRYIYK